MMKILIIQIRHCQTQKTTNGRDSEPSTLARHFISISTMEIRKVEPSHQLLKNLLMKRIPTSTKKVIRVKSMRYSKMTMTILAINLWNKMKIRTIIKQRWKSKLWMRPSPNLSNEIFSSLKHFWKINFVHDQIYSVFHYFLHGLLHTSCSM